ncbi:MAG: secretin N-terminal domain-containing protein [Candidatus Saelkia tenebricola]|nr:secretin N-terminal domain-containing protein [Candidatus Saelkia tenebricola]
MKKIIATVLLFMIFYNIAFAVSQEQTFTILDNKIAALEIKDAKISDVLRLLAEQFGLNLVISDKVEGNISVKFFNISVEEAIDAIVTVNGYAYTKKGSVIKVTTPEEIEKEAPFTRVFVLNNAVAEDLKPSLEKALSNIGSIEINARSNALIVTDTSNAIDNVGKLIENLDKETPQVLIEAKIIETNIDDDKKLGIKWTMKATATGAKRPHTLPFRKVGPKSFFPENIGSSTVAGSVTTDAFPYGHGFPYATTGDFTFGTLNFTEFQAVLQAIEQDIDTKVLSHPRVVTLNNKQAKILVGTKIPIPIYTFNEETGTYEISGYDEEEVGISLEVTPHVSPDEKITITLHPVVSDFTGVYVGPNDERPYIDTREVITQVQLKDGETVAIGGLIKQKEIDTVDKVPILGNIPLLGFIFRHKRKEFETTDLLIFVTATIVRTQEKKEDKIIEIKSSFKPAKNLE